MARKTLVVVTSALLVLSGAAAADAASKKPTRPKAVCLQIPDAPGDAQVGGSNNPTDQPQYASLDITSVDVASGPKNVAAAIRVSTLTPDAYVVAGATYDVLFDAGATTYHLTYRTFFGGSSEFTYNSSAMTAGQFLPIEGGVDQASKTITMYLPRKAVPELKKAGTKLVNIKGQTGAGQNFQKAGGVYSSRGYTGVDTATRAGYSYVDLTPTCIKGT